MVFAAHLKDTGPRYPHCLYFLELLQSEEFRSNLARNDVAVMPLPCAMQQARSMIIFTEQTGAGVRSLATVLLLAAPQKAGDTCELDCCEIVKGTASCAGVEKHRRADRLQFDDYNRVAEPALLSYNILHSKVNLEVYSGAG